MPVVQGLRGDARKEDSHENTGTARVDRLRAIAAIRGQAGAGDVAGFRAAEKGNEFGQSSGLA